MTCPRTLGAGAKKDALRAENTCAVSLKSAGIRSSRHSAMHCSEAEAHWVRRLKAHSPGCAAGASVVVAKAHKVGAARSSDGPRWTGTGIGAGERPTRNDTCTGAGPLPPLECCPQHAAVGCPPQRDPPCRSSNSNDNASRPAAWRHSRRPRRNRKRIPAVAERRLLPPAAK